MSSVPAEIAGIGSTAMKLRVSPGFDPLKAQVGPEEYFVLSRIDGTQTLREVLLSTGLPVDRGIAIVTRLRAIGALLLPGESTAPAAPIATPTKPVAGSVPNVARTMTPHMPSVTRMPARPAAPPMSPIVPARPVTRPSPTEIDPPTQPRSSELRRPAPPAAEQLDAPTVRRAPAADINVVLPNATDAERAALAEPGELGPDDRLRILAMARLVEQRDPWALLGLPSGASAKDLKRAYFKLSKEIHPDRYFGKKLGSFAERLTVVFEAVSRAYAKLTSPEKRPSAAYQAAPTEQPQTPQEYAAELFDRACGLEVGGDALGAMKLFAAAVRIDPHTRYLRRAASCALAAEQPKTALEYAKKAQTQSPNDPSAARLLAQAFKATGKFADAEEVLVMAMALKNENDVLTAELRNDLAEIRRLMAG